MSINFQLEGVIQLAVGTTAERMAVALLVGQQVWDTDQHVWYSGDDVTLGGRIVSGVLPLNSQSAAYTLVLSDMGKIIFHPASDITARIWTFPANATVPFPIGSTITFDNDVGAGPLTIAIAVDTLVLVGSAGTTGARTLAGGGRATAVKVAATRWRISGGAELT